MKILALDTSTEACSCALMINNEVFSRFEIAPRRHAELLLGMIDELLQNCKLQLSSLDAIAVGCGPGSFMGVRLATGVAQGLGYSANLPVIPVSSLQAIAQRAFDETSHAYIIAGWDARMGEIYWGSYTNNGQGMMVSLDTDHLNSPSEIEVARDKPWTLVGNAWNIYQSELPAPLQLESQLIYPHAEAMLPIAAERLKQGDILEAAKLKPNYLRTQVAFHRT